MPQPNSDQLSEENKKVLKSISPGRIFIPTAIGLAVVFYLIWKESDVGELATLTWNRHSLFWLLMAILCLALRHFFYMWRLRIITDNFFSWWKCFEMTIIWEFSSAVSPTAVGGSAVALFVFAQEKLSAGKTALIIVFTVILDALFFLLMLPVLYLIVGPVLLDGIQGEWVKFLYPAYGAMVIYASIFAYGIFIAPKRMKRFFFMITRKGWLKRFNRKAVQIGNDMTTTSKELKKKRFGFYLGSFLTTAGAWSFRFILLNCLLLAFVAALPTDTYSQLLIFARQEALYLIMALAPSPGGAGFAEVAFRDFLHDFQIPMILSLPWRFLTYYVFLIAGALVVPNWIRKVYNRRKEA